MKQAIDKYNERYSNTEYAQATAAYADNPPYDIERAVKLQDTAIWVCGGQKPENVIQFIETLSSAEFNFLKLFE